MYPCTNVVLLVVVPVVLCLTGVCEKAEAAGGDDAIIHEDKKYTK
jgi:hypothetical protein